MHRNRRVQVGEGWGRGRDVAIAQRSLHRVIVRGAADNATVPIKEARLELTRAQILGHRRRVGALDKRLPDNSVPKITHCLWFDGRAEEAANFYVSLLPDSHGDKIWRSRDRLRDVPRSNQDVQHPARSAGRGVPHGAARIAEGGAADMLQRLARTFRGPHVTFPGMPDPPPGFITHKCFERVSGIGTWRK